MATWFLVCALATAGIPHVQWPTLREELRKHGISADALPDADRRITSYAVKADPEWFGIAYYWFTGTDVLPDELRIRILDRGSRRWSDTIVPASARNGGSAFGIDRRAGYVYLHLHINPSAADLLVLTSDLRVRRQLSGWPMLFFPDGRVIYQNNMVHFAPAHPGSVSLYDPRSDRDVRLYPATVEPLRSPRWIDRSIGAVEQIGRDRIQIKAREQRVLVGEGDRGVSDGPVREVLVTCELSSATPTCSARPAATR